MAYPDRPEIDFNAPELSYQGFCSTPGSEDIFYETMIAILHRERAKKDKEERVHPVVVPTDILIAPNLDQTILTYVLMSRVELADGSLMQVTDNVISHAERQGPHEASATFIRDHNSGKEVVADVGRHVLILEGLELLYRADAESLRACPVRDLDA